MFKALLFVLLLSGGNALSFSLLSIILAVGLPYICGLYYFEVHLYTQFLESFFHHKWMLHSVESSVPVGMIIWFLFFSLLIGVSC